MTDEELLKRVAEIEGWCFKAPYGWWATNEEGDAQVAARVDADEIVYDWAAMALVKKYHMDIEYIGDTGYGKKNGLNWLACAGSKDALDADLNRAILLAVVGSQS